MDDPRQGTLALDEAATLAENFEGFSPTPYQDAVGVWTIGFGSIWWWSPLGERVGRVTAGTPAISRETAHQWMMWELEGNLRDVERLVSVALTSDEKAALIDFDYNLGAGNLAHSTLLRKLNAGDYAGAAQEFDKWDMAGGKVLAGLLRRRQAETDLFKRSV